MGNSSGLVTTDPTMALTDRGQVSFLHGYGYSYGYGCGYGYGYGCGSGYGYGYSYV